MSEPSGFIRPKEWEQLDDPNRQGLGGHATGPDFGWPTGPASPGVSGRAGYPPPALPRPAAVDPALPPAEVQRQKRAAVPRPVDAWTPPRRSRTAVGSLFRTPFLSTRRKVALVILAVLTALTVITSVVGMVTGSSRTRPTYPSYTPPARPSAQPAVWDVKVAQLRTDLAKPGLIDGLDGSFDDVRVIDAGASWLVFSGDAQDTGLVVHALDPKSGAELWRHDLPSGLCARALVDGAVLCASATRTDPATGLGTKWHLALLDPATGKERRGAGFDGWLTLIYAVKDRVLLVEQRQPAPHAVLTILDAALTQSWQQDLRDRPQHAGMFSDNRITSRSLPIPRGPALDRPRIRTVADGLTALWVGRTTVFIDLARHRLVGMPMCSRLVDDGERLWCNQGDRATALNYRVEPLYKSELGTRLAFPDRDPRAGDVTDPVFLTSQGKAVRVDLTTGRTLGPLANTQNGSAFGMVTSPRTAYVAGLTLIWDSSNMFAVKARTGELVWQLERSYFSGEALDWDGRILLAGNELTMLDRRTGKTLSRHDQPYGYDTVALGDVLVGTGGDEIARLVDP